MPRTKSERKAQQRLCQKRRYQEIKNDPKLLALEREKRRQKYKKRKEQGKLVNSITELTPRAQRELRKKWKENAKRYRQRKIEKSQEQMSLDAVTINETEGVKIEQPELTRSIASTSFSSESCDTNSKNSEKIFEMPRTYRKAPDRRVPTEEQLEAAKELIAKGVTKRQAATQVGLKESTLRYRLKFGNAVESMGSNIPTFTKAQEEEIYQYVKKSDDNYNGITMNRLRHLVYEYAETNNIPHRFNTSRKQAGRDWVFGFTKRFPELKLRQSTSTADKAQEENNEDNIEDYDESSETSDYILSDIESQSTSHIMHEVHIEDPLTTYAPNLTKTIANASSRDEEGVFGEYVACKLRNMKPDMKSLLQYKINTMIFKAEMGLLSMDE